MVGFIKALTLKIMCEIGQLCSARAFEQPSCKGREGFVNLPSLSIHDMTLLRLVTRTMRTVTKERDRERETAFSKASKKRGHDVRKTFRYWNPLWPSPLSTFRDDVCVELTQPPFLHPLQMMSPSSNEDHYK